MAYLHKSPYIIRWLYSDLTWKGKSGNQTLYLTFDDGPVPEATPLVLNTLAQFNIKATFFCVGENIRKHPDVFREVLAGGHSIGNHSYNHLNGWKTSLSEYTDNVKKCREEISKFGLGNNIFRPPYGRITRAQITFLKRYYTIIMWDVLSGDFDPSLSAESCLKKTIKATNDGSIVIFHDSIKAMDKLHYSLPAFIEHSLQKGYKFSPL